MKIAQISTAWISTPPSGYGGTEAVVSTLTEALVLLGHDVTLFATGDSQTTADLWSWFDTRQLGFQWTDEMLHVVKAYEQITHSDFDIIHNHTYYLGPFLLSRTDLPSVTTSHSPYIATYVKFHQTLCSNHRFIAISQAQRRLMPELNWIGVVHNAIDTAQFSFRADKDDYLLFIGSIQRKKGPHLAIEVAKATGRRLVLAGPLQRSGERLSGDEQKNTEDFFQREIEPYVDGKQIIYLGEVDQTEKVRLYQHASALLVPILWEEMFGLVMIEALACGTPVIAFARGGAPEIVQSGHVGFLVNTAEEMQLAIENIKHISPAACREYAEAHFDTQVMTRRYLNLYEMITNRK